MPEDIRNYTKVININPLYIVTFFKKLSGNSEGCTKLNGLAICLKYSPIKMIPNFGIRKITKAFTAQRCYYSPE